MQHPNLPGPGCPVILANGLFPESVKALNYLRQSCSIICCDGAAHSLKALQLMPEVIVGDLDSLDHHHRIEFADRLIKDSDQETNDLTKAINWAVQNQYQSLVILGADGKRLDHTIGNAALLAEHCELASMIMITDQGKLIPLSGSTSFDCTAGQQVSIFPMDPGMTFTSTGLKYPLNSMVLERWWQGTLNETLGSQFSLEFTTGKALVYIND